MLIKYFFYNPDYDHAPKYNIGKISLDQNALFTYFKQENIIPTLTTFRYLYYNMFISNIKYTFQLESNSKSKNGNYKRIICEEFKKKIKEDMTDFGTSSIFKIYHYDMCGKIIKMNHKDEFNKLLRHLNATFNNKDIYTLCDHPKCFGYNNSILSF